jgi:hypothetical protein
MKLFGKALLTTIRSGTVEEMYNLVTNASFYLATGGFLEEANQMLSALWKHQLPHGHQTGLADRTLEVLWHAAGNRPSNVPFQSLTIDQLEVDHREYVAVNCYTYPEEESDWRTLMGKAAFRQAQTWFPTFEHDTDTLFLLEKALQSPTDLVPYEICRATAMAAEIAAIKRNIPLARQMIQRWAENLVRPASTIDLAILAQQRHLAPFVLKGILAQALRLSKESCQRMVEEVTVAIDHRMQVGRSLAYGDWHWNELLHKLSELAIVFGGEEFSKEERQTQWIGREKASEENITATERRLKLTLPDDYKGFLRASNGLSAFPFCNPQLLAVEDIGWYKHMEEKELYEITRTYVDEESEDSTIEPYTERALLISYIPDEQMVWLIPPAEEADDWQTWFFAAWLPGEKRYPSFRYFMEECVLKLEGQGNYYDD